MPLPENIYRHRYPDVRAIEFCEVDSIYKLFGNSASTYFNGLDEGEVQLKQRGQFVNPGQWIVWRSDIDVSILSPDQFHKEFVSSNY